MLAATLPVALDPALREEPIHIKRQQWIDANQRAMDDYNAWTMAHGVFGEAVRTF